MRAYVLCVWRVIGAFVCEAAETTPTERVRPTGTFRRRSSSSSKLHVTIAVYRIIINSSNSRTGFSAPELQVLLLPLSHHLRDAVFFLRHLCPCAPRHRLRRRVISVVAAVARCRL